MTSSLVGSEMCIRDSCKMRTQRSFAWGSLVNPSPRPGIWEAQRMSLSLIHILTLPTICSV
eukprot:1628222-Prorocentrum_lima.AAC.1